MRHTSALLGILATPLLAACGVAFTPADQDNEFFQSLEVSGDKRVGHPLTAAVTYEQYYPVDVAFACELRQETELVKPVAEFNVKALEGGSPEATPFPGNFAFDFVVDEPGTYRVECLTPRDEDNYIIDEFDVGPAPEATPTPALGADEDAQ